MGDGVVLSSTDGVNWVATNNSLMSDFVSIIWTGSEFIAASDNGYVASSTDGLSWTILNQNTHKSINSLSFTDQTFAAVGDDGLFLKSNDGTTWSESTVLGSPQSHLDITANGSNFAIVGDNPYFFYSVAPTTWASQILPHNLLRSFVWTGTQYVAVGHLGTIMTSQFGTSWQTRVSGTDKLFNKIIWTGTQLIAVGDDGLVANSNDGINWNVQVIEQLRVSGSYFYRINDVIWTGSEILLIPSYPVSILKSSDGLNWSLLASEDELPEKIIFTGSEYIGIDYEYIFTSKNGQTWSKSKFGAESLNDIFYFDNKVFIVTRDEKIILSDLD